MHSGWERTIALCCYLGALRVPVVALVLPEWAFTLPSGLLAAGAAWAYGRRRSPFLRYHGREGFRWTLQANLLVAGIALLGKALYYGWFYSGLPALNWLWHFSATGFRWTGALISVLTLVAMYKAARGDTSDALAQARQTG